MEIRAATGDLTAIQADAIVVNLFEGATEPGGTTGQPVQSLVNFVLDYAEQR